MENINQVTRYHRIGRKNESARKEVVIYVRGNSEKMQEIFCKLYAIDNDYRVLYTTRNIEDVNLCDKMLILDPSRISRDRTEYEKIKKDLKVRGIEVESVAKSDSDIHNIFSA